MTKNLDFLKKYKYTHRGLHSEKVSENSLESFKLAIEKNYAIELDIRVTKDGNWIVFHDDNLLRMTGSNIKIKDLLFDELNNYKLINNNEKIPLLSDVLDLVNNKVPLLIEIKHIKKTRKNLKNLFEILDNYKGDFAVFSFSPIIVYLIKKYRKNYIRGQISSFLIIRKFLNLLNISINRCFLIDLQNLILFHIISKIFLTNILIRLKKKVYFYSDIQQRALMNTIIH